MLEIRKQKKLENAYMSWRLSNDHEAKGWEKNQWNPEKQGKR
jgi:hypothetical protein